MAFYCNGKKGICDKISSSLGVCPLDCEFGDGTGGYNVAVPMPKPMTNADHLRAMSDEELCEFILEIRENGNCLNDRCYATDPNKGCDDCTMEWLKAPYKENEE